MKKLLLFLLLLPVCCFAQGQGGSGVSANPNIGDRILGPDGTSSVIAEGSSGIDFNGGTVGINATTLSTTLGVIINNGLGGSTLTIYGVIHGGDTLTAMDVTRRRLIGHDGTTVMLDWDDESEGAVTGHLPVEFCIALSDETTAITTGTAKVTWRAPYAFTVTSVRASVNTVSSSGIPTVDINESGTTILSTKLTIDATELTSTTAAAPAVISDSAIADDAEITMDIDVAGTGAKGLKVWILGHR